MLKDLGAFPPDGLPRAMCDFERALQNSIKKNMPWAAVINLPSCLAYVIVHALSLIFVFQMLIMILLALCGVPYFLCFFYSCNRLGETQCCGSGSGLILPEPQHWRDGTISQVKSWSTCRSVPACDKCIRIYEPFQPYFLKTLICKTKFQSRSASAPASDYCNRI